MFNKTDNWFIYKTSLSKPYLKNSNNRILALTPAELASDLLSLSSITDTTITATEGTLYMVKSISSDITINLPKISSVNAGKEIAVKIQLSNMGGNVVTYQASSGDTIDGQDSYVINVPYLYLKIKSDGLSSWMII